MPHKRTYAVEVIKVSGINEMIMGFVPSELEDWDYTDPRSGVVRVKKLSNGKFAYFPQEGAAEEVISTVTGGVNRVVLCKELRKMFEIRSRELSYTQHSQ